MKKLVLILLYGLLTERHVKFAEFFLGIFMDQNEAEVHEKASYLANKLAQYKNMLAQQKIYHII